MNSEAHIEMDDLLDARQVKRILNISLPWIYKAADQGLIPCVRIPCPGKGKIKPRSIVRFRKEDIFNFLEEHYQRT